MKTPVYHPLFAFTLKEAQRRANRYSDSGPAKIRDEARFAVHAICEDAESLAKGPHGKRCYRFKTTNIAYYIYFEIVGESVLVLALVHPRRSPEYLKKILRDYHSKL